jgi:hypothetical protein
MKSTICSVFFIVSLFGGEAPAIQDGTENAGDLISLFRELPRGKVAEKIALVERIHLCGTDEAVRFVAHLADKAKENAVRARAFFFWASSHSRETILEFLEARKKSSRFGEYIPVIPEIDGFDGFDCLSAFYGDEILTHHEPAIFGALAALDDERSFAFLEEQWKKIDGAGKAYDRLVILFGMRGSWSVEFLDGLLMSRHPYGRCVAAERMLASNPVLALSRIEVFLQTEVHPLVRSHVLRALADLGTSEAAGLLLRTSEWHPSRRLSEVVEALASIPAEKVKEVLPKNWYSGKNNTRRFRVAALALLRPRPTGVSRPVASSGDRELARRIKAAEKSRDPATRIVAAVARGRISKNEDRIQRLIMAGDSEARWEILDTIERFRITDSFVVRKVAAVAESKKSWELQIKAAGVLGVLGNPESVPSLEKTLVAPNLLVRVAAIKALTLIRDRRIVELLIERLPKEKGRASWEIARALKALTSRYFGIESAKWNAWWKQQGGAFAFPDARVEGRAAWVPPDADEGRYSFYGMAIDSHNIVFAIDVSGSMAGPYAGGGQKEAPIARLRRELTRTIKSLTPEHFINMVFFETTVRRWRAAMAPMKSDKGSYKAEALTYARYLRAEGGTNLYGALMTAMADPEVDAIVLLSDGDPTEGRIVEKGAILGAVLRRNRVLQASIHVIGLGKADAAFLKRIALGTGGTFKML